MKRNKILPDKHIILDIIKEKEGINETVLTFYENYIRGMATDPIYSKDGIRAGYCYDDDLAQELRLALSQCLPALRRALIKHNMENRPVVL